MRVFLIVLTKDIPNLCELKQKFLDEISHSSGIRPKKSWKIQLEGAFENLS